jgi:hypothetical protein
VLQNPDGNKRGGAGPTSATLRLSSVTESCHRNISPGVTGAWAINLTINGKLKGNVKLMVVLSATWIAQSSTREFLSSLLWVAARVDNLDDRWDFTN